ncbi:hypothetical protein [Donghicola mangrovi]|uniref:Type I secretion protein n=1 Tax=Donghicola mangrovi TaxID=2729614 RepID=A0A850Q773_9RHOB|nr:hypothetical protein [Donghicola mangrovi]NVO22858.1 hypothetical protein [Donghicola mangrovi]
MTLGFMTEGKISTDALSISSDSFGARYVSFRSFEQFDNAFSQTDLGMVIWPGGTMAEKNPERFGFEHHGLYNSEGTNGKPDLEDMMQYCVEKNLSLTVVLPTARYADDHDLLREHLSGFLDDLYSGEYGDLPKSLTFEVGNEYYAVMGGSDEIESSATYAGIVNVYSDVVLDKEAEYPDASTNVEWHVQLGRSVEATEEILDHLSEDSILMTDAVVHHRFAVTLQASDTSIDDVHASLDAWEEETEALGIDRPSLSLSAYNTASLSRVEAAQSFLATEEGSKYDFEDLDLDGRSNVEFEQHYQEMLDYRPYGLEQGEHILQMFSEYQALGTSSSGVYGWDVTHASRSSYEGTDGHTYLFTPGSVQDMMAESLDGTKVLDWFQENELDNDQAVTTYGFDSEDKLVMFVVAPSDFRGDVFSLDVPLENLGDITEVWGESLRSETPDNWKDLFGVPDLPDVDQTPEAETYALGIRESFSPEVKNGVIQLDFTQPSQIIRLTFARNDDAADEIADWHGGASTDLEAGDSDGSSSALVFRSEEDVLPLIEVDEDEQTDDQNDSHHSGDSGGSDDGGAGFGGLLATVLLGLMGIGI